MLRPANLIRSLFFPAAVAVLASGFGVVPAQETGDRIDHLLKAAVHLDQAGCADKAAEIRALATREEESQKQRLFERKLAELAQLQREVDALRQTLKSTPQVLVRLQVLELQLDRLQESGLGLVSLRQLFEGVEPTSMVDDSGHITQFLDLLRNQGLIVEVASPTLVTTSGRPASLAIGGREAATTAQPTKLPPGGLRLDCTPTIDAGGAIRLDLHFRRTTPLPPAASASAAPPVPAESCLEIQTVVDCQPGQPLILAGPYARKGPATVATLLVIRTELVQPAAE